MNVTECQYKTSELEAIVTPTSIMHEPWNTKDHGAKVCQMMPEHELWFQTIGNAQGYGGADDA